MSHPALRIVGGIAAGAALAMATMIAIGSAGHTLFPPPAGTGLGIVVAPGREIPSSSLGLRLTVLAGWALSSLLGAMLAARIVRRRWAVWPIALLVTSGAAANATITPDPLWMTLAGIALPLAAAGLAQRFAYHR